MSPHGNVHLVYTLITDLAIAVLPKPMPIVMYIQTRFLSIDVDHEGRRIDDLVHVDVDHPRHAAHPLRNLPGERVVGSPVLAHDLDVDGRGQAEIQDLANDVAGLEEECRVRELSGELLAQRLHVREGRVTTLGLQGNQDLAVGGADGRAVAERQVDPAHG